MEIVVIEGAGAKRASEKVLELDVPFEKLCCRNGTLGCRAVRRFGKQPEFVLHPEGKSAAKFACQGEGEMRFMPAPVLTVYERHENGESLLGQIFPVEDGISARERAHGGV